MERTEIHIPAPQRFDLRRTLNDHGWVVLAPNRQLDQAQGLGRGMRLPDGRAVAVEISGHATLRQSCGLPDRILGGRSGKMMPAVAWHQKSATCCVWMRICMVFMPSAGARENPGVIWRAAAGACCAHHPFSRIWSR